MCYTDIREVIMTIGQIRLRVFAIAAMVWVVTFLGVLFTIYTAMMTGFFLSIGDTFNVLLFGILTGINVSTMNNMVAQSSKMLLICKKVELLRKTPNIDSETFSVELLKHIESIEKGEPK